MGGKIKPVRLESLKYSLPTYYVLTSAEAYSNLARYDGIRYGFRYFLVRGDVTPN